MKFPTEIGLIKPGGLVDPKHMKVMTRFPDHEGVCHHGALAICLNLPGSKWVIAECANGFTNAPYLHSWVKHNGAALTGGRLNADGLIGYYPDATGLYQMLEPSNPAALSKVECKRLMRASSGSLMKAVIKHMLTTGSIEQNGVAA